MKISSLFQKKECLMLVAWLLLSIGGVLQAQENTITLSYDQIAPLVREKNGQVQSTRLSISSAKARIGSLQRATLPQVSASLGGETFYNGGFNQVMLQPFGSLDVSLNLFRGGQDAQEEAIRQAQVTIAETQSQRLYANELMQAQWLYWDIVCIEELLSNTQDILDQHAKSYASTKRRFQRGLLTQSDLLGFELYKSQLEETLESLTHEKKILVMKLKPVLGLSEQVALNVSQAKLAHDHEESFLKETLSVDQIPEIQELSSQEQLVGFQFNKLAGKSKPSLDLFGSYTLYTEAERSFSNALDRAEMAGGIRAQFLLLDGNQTESELKSLSLKQKALFELLAYKKKFASTEIKGFQEEMIYLHELFHRSEDRLSQAEKFLNHIFEDYDRGVKDSTDVLTALQLYQTVQESYVNQKKTYQKVKCALWAMLSPLQ